MMQTAHDTLHELDRGPPLWFTASGWLMPAGILTQFLLAGRALFAGSDFATHAMLGSLLVLPALALLLGALLVKRLRGFRWWAGILWVLMLVQFAFASSASANSGIDRDAPVLVQTTVDVAASPELVWEVLTEPARWASWNKLIASARIEGSVAEGSLIEWATAPEAGGFSIRSQITLVGRNRVLEWRGIGGNMVALHSWRLEPIAGGTRVHNDESVRGGEAESMPQTLRAQFEWFLKSWNTALGEEIERRLRD